MIMPILAVANVSDSIAFYQDKLGFSVGVNMPGDDGNPFFAIVDKGESAHIGLQLDSTAGERGKGVIFMVYVPEGTDMEAYYNEVQGNGATIAEPLKEEYWGDQLFSVTDPDGYYLSLCKTVKQMTPDEIAEAAKQTAG
jgi:PhnB protein